MGKLSDRKLEEDGAAETQSWRTKSRKCEKRFFLTELSKLHFLTLHSGASSVGELKLTMGLSVSIVDDALIR